jgi:hypothetical protein
VRVSKHLYMALSTVTTVLRNTTVTITKHYFFFRDQLVSAVLLAIKEEGVKM